MNNPKLNIRQVISRLLLDPVNDASRSVTALQAGIQSAAILKPVSLQALPIVIFAMVPTAHQ